MELIGVNRWRELFRTPLLHLEFQEKCIETIFEQYFVQMKLRDNECVQERSTSVRKRGFSVLADRKSNAPGGRETILLNWRKVRLFERYSGFYKRCDRFVHEQFKL